MDVWHTITEDGSDEYDTDVRRHPVSKEHQDTGLRQHPAYRHHFAFFYRLARRDSLDDEMLDSAMEAAHAAAIAGHQSWDGGKSIWESWYGLREDTISDTSNAEILEWKQKYILILPGLFHGYSDDLDLIKQTLRSHSDLYMQQVISHLITV